MDIRNWGINKIMQLPDWCFGRRWNIITVNTVANGATEQWIVDQKVPDKIVLWSLRVFGSMGDISTSWMKFAIGDHQPANDAEFDALERLFKGDFDRAVDEGGIPLGKYHAMVFDTREVIQMNGMRFVVQLNNAHGSVAATLCFAFKISSVPTEVPDWLVSGKVNAL